MTDAELVRRVLSGRTEDYEELVRRWAGSVLALCQALVGQSPVALDLAQDTLLRGLRDLPSLVEPARFGSWLRGLSRSICLDWIKNRRGLATSFHALEPHGALGFFFGLTRENGDREGIEREEELRSLLAEVEGLPEACREVLLLRCCTEGSYASLAELLEVTPATVAARLAQARDLLRERRAAGRKVDSLE
jgi:RNA polymerase sigma factor (sigma-70 family)